MQIKESKTKKILAIAALSGLLLVFSCTEKYWPELKSTYDQLLVVDGKITNEPGPYTIRLSTSSSIEIDQFNPISGARIMIVDNAGNSELLKEKETGVYQTEASGIQGVIGNEYKITIEVNGKSYESSFEELKNPVEIESLSAEWVNNKGATATDDEYGYQFYLTTETAVEPINFYYWELTETYHYQAFHNIYSIYYGTNNVGKNGFGVPIKSDTLKNCWKTNQINERFTYTTKNLTSPKVNLLPINFVPNSIKYRFKYALQAKQYNISENAYAFLSSLQEQNNIENALYTSQPFQILGNIYNINDPEEPVLGYFLTAGVSSSQPIMLTSPIGYITPVNWNNCDDELTELNTAHVIERVLNMSPSNWPVIIATNPDSEDPEPIIVEPECVDCRVKGGIPIRPDYWDDNSLLFTIDDQKK